MNMYEWLESVKVGLSLFFLFYASWCDYKYREVSNKVWALFAPSGLTLTFTYIVLVQGSLLIALVTSFLVVAGISVALFYLDAFGGADAKALICLALTFPWYPVSLKPFPGAISFLFPLSVFNNAILMAALTALGIMSYNVVWHVRTGEGLFEGLEHEASWKKVLALITGHKVAFQELKEKRHLFPLEELSVGEAGTVTRRLRVFVPAGEDRESSVANLEKFSGRLDGKIWATPGLPLLIFLTFGLLVALFFGDVVLWLTFQWVSF